MADVFQMLASGRPGRGAAQKKALVEFRAGKMVRDGRMVKPDTRKGTISLDVGDDTLLHFYWKDRGTNRVELDLIIFPEEAEFIKVEQSNDRVFMLAFKSSSQKHFFWMQEPKADKDAELVENVNLAINDPAAAMAKLRSPTSPGARPMALTPDQAQMMRALQNFGTGVPNRQPPAAAAAPAPAPATAASPTSTAAAAAPATPAGASSDEMARIRSILAGIQVPQGEPDVDLSAVLTIDNVRPVLANQTAREALFPHLPEGSAPTTTELEDTVRSPPFRQALQTLTYALRNGQLSTILTSMGLDPSSAGDAQGVDAFLKAVVALVEKEKQGENQDDSMDTS
ncbi:hypothetical protein GGF31_005685 [Allomyces arbusculus]|nr:hypothetical protein GGF31_005685 [Allomyces arbusculus]